MVSSAGKQGESLPSRENCNSSGLVAEEGHWRGRKDASVAGAQ